MPSFLENPGLRLLFFGGKGGCGKTSSAAAAALSLSRLRSQRKILVVSTDPAHSLGDSLDCRLSGADAPVPATDNLWAVELDARGLHEDFRKRHGATLQEIVEHGTYLDREDAGSLFSLPLPGLDEIMAILEIAKLLRSRRYDLIVVDTAPTGHTLRLLAMPRHMQGWTRVLGLMQAKHRQLALSFAGAYRKGEADRFLEGMNQDILGVQALLHDSRATEFVPVAIPEPMSLLETERLLRGLRKCGIAVRNIILNRVEQGYPLCGRCRSRQKSQQECLGRMGEAFDPYNVIKVPLFPGEVRGTEALMRYADFLASPVVREPAMHRGFANGRAESKPELPRRQIVEGGGLRRLLDEPKLRFLLFAGKGGVGKTSLASAAALRLCRQFPEKRVLISSIDPAHSLSDSFGFPLGDRPTPIPGFGNLDGLEIDAARRYEDFKRRYGKLAQAGLERLTQSGVDAPYDREVAGEIASLIPPGIDEIIAFSEILEMLQQGRYDLFVVDAAPAGHLLRFLELPGLMRQWIKALLNILLKHRNLARLDSLAKEMLELSRKVRELQALFCEAGKAECVAVTIPEAMAVLETERLLAELARLKFSCRHVVANMVLEPTSCPFCSNRRKEQELRLREMRQWSSHNRFVSTVPLWPKPVGGTQMLDEISSALFGGEG